ncbi:MAG: hypothetical protein J5822_03115 [Eubacteriaceae bacterium]|nr:hypothetical protein [Eubacteriaceae bacterium]
MNLITNLRDSEECTGDCKSCGLECEEKDAEEALKEYVQALLDRKLFRVGVAMDDSSVAQKVSMDSVIKVYDLDGEMKVVDEELLFPMQNDVSSSGLADYLNKMDVKVLLTGNISPVLKEQMEILGIDVKTGVRGSVPFALRQYLTGKLG